jgi:myosin V
MRSNRSNTFKSIYTPQTNNLDPSRLTKHLVWIKQENHDMLIRCIAQHCGFSGSRPVAACIIFKCLLNWRSFEVERTSVFDRIIQTIGHAIEVGYSITMQV